MRRKGGSRLGEGGEGIAQGGLLVSRGFPSTRGSLGQVPPGDVVSPGLGAAASIGGRASRVVTQSCCLYVTGSPGWGREALVLIEHTRISLRHLTSFHLTF